MTYKKILTLVLSTSILWSSCSKDPIESTENNTISTQPATNKCDYSPYSVGSSFTTEIASKSFWDDKWTYVEQKGVVTGTETINSKLWSVGKGFYPADTTSNSSTNGYMRCDNTGAYALLKGAINGKDLELPIIQYPVTKGKTWSSPAITYNLQGLTYSTYYTYKVLNVGLTKKVKNTTYNNVVEIEEASVSVIKDGTDTDTFTNTYLRYYDKSVGHIQTIFFNIDPFNNTKDTAVVHSLVSYNIK